MFELACELENRTDKPVTVHLTMRGSPEPVINVIEPNQGLGVFQPVDGSTVKIAIISTEAGDE